MNTTEREPVRSARVRFALMGFDQDAAIRQYAFQGMTDGIHTNFTVGVNLALIPSFGIHIQELPLLCRKLLERQVEGQENHALTVGEGEMRVYADDREMAQGARERKRKFARNP